MSIEQRPTGGNEILCFLGPASLALILLRHKAGQTIEKFMETRKSTQLKREMASQMRMEANRLSHEAEKLES